MSRARALDPRRVLAWTAAYEEWLRAQAPFVVEPDLDDKHDAMADSPFVFLRATYYVWTRQWPAALPALADAPEVIAVGDLHFENFGTWRDAEGRLCWGVNDFDEASRLPYTNDLVRLATSVALAADDARIRTPAAELSRRFLRSYRRTLARGGRAVVFGRGHRRLQAHILADLLRRARARQRRAARDGREASDAPADCRQALERALPRGSAEVAVAPRVAGVGSLGRPRFTASARWNGGAVVREAKARVPSAAVWRAGGGAEDGDALADLLGRSVRSPDPFLHLSGRWIVRRLAADTEKIEIDVKRLPGPLERRLAALMGRELANVHVASGDAAAILADLRRRPRGFLVDAAGAMAALTGRSHDAWRKDWKARRRR